MTRTPRFGILTLRATVFLALPACTGQIFRAFHQQVRWWVDQFAYLLQSLAGRPEDGGTMLDNSIVLLCTEISDGNTHRHDNMPFVLAGGGGGSVRTGQVLQFADAPHAGLYSAIAQALGRPTKFGQVNAGPLPGLLVWSLGHFSERRPIDRFIISSCHERRKPRRSAVDAPSSARAARMRPRLAGLGRRAPDSQREMAASEHPMPRERQACFPITA